MRKSSQLQALTYQEVEVLEEYFAAWGTRSATLALLDMLIVYYWRQGPGLLLCEIFEGSDSVTGFLCVVHG